MTSSVFGLRAAESPARFNRAQHSRFTMHRVLRRRRQPVDARLRSICQDIVAHDDPDARRRLVPFHDLVAVRPGGVPAAKGMRSSAAVQGGSRRAGKSPG
jgi:hypothetical protein